MSLQVSLQDAVNELVNLAGDDPDSLADTLRRMGIRGVPECSETCALAEFISPRVTGPGALVEVETATIRAFIYDDEGEPEEEARVDTPPVLERFILAFDAGRYPGLMVPRAQTAGASDV